MTEVETNVWEIELVLNKGEQFKLRQGGGWNVQAGVANDKTGETTSGYYVRLQDGSDEPGNIVVDVSGTYVLRFTWEEGTHNCTLELIAQ